MATVSAYWRPASIAQALELLDRPGAVAMGGGTAINASPPGDPVEVVDLQALGLGAIEPAEGGRVVIGATTTLQALVDSGEAPDLVREAARCERPSTLRAQATIGGRVATGDPDSELLAALLVHDAVVRVAGHGGVELPLPAVLAGLPLDAGRVVVAVTVGTGGRGASARVGRTPADTPIVAAYGRTGDAGTPGAGGRRIALTGVAPTPVLVGGVEDVARLEPRGDFRGSAAYRLSLAATLVARVVEVLR